VQNAKDWAKLLLKGAARRLPWGARHALLDSLIQSFGEYNVLGEIGHRLRVKSMAVDGANGLMVGALDDPHLFGRYATAGSWATTTLSDISGWFDDHGGGTFLDIGANIGLTIVPISRNPAVTCIGFEPEPRNFTFLSKNVQANCPHGNVVVHQLALYDQKGQLSMAISPINSGDHQLCLGPVRSEENQRRLVEVQVDRLDDVLDAKTLKMPLVIKIDAQGAEPGIFAGGRQIISSASLMSIEFWPRGMRRYQCDVEVELSVLAENFREASVVPGDTEERMQWIDIHSAVDQLRAHWNDARIGNRILMSLFVNRLRVLTADA
jgi:FkbM family methyltransferase